MKDNRKDYSTPTVDLIKRFEDESENPVTRGVIREMICKRIGLKEWKIDPTFSMITRDLGE